MKMIIFVRDRDGVYVASATIDADGIAVRPRAVWNTPDPDQHGTAMLWAYDDQRSMVVSPLNTLLVDGSAWTVDAVSFNEGLLYVSPVDGYSDPFAEKGDEKGGEKGGIYQFAAKGQEVRHGMQLIATATSGKFAQRIAESLNLYRGKLTQDRRDERRRAEREGR
jgi:hypothetical protein